MGSSDNDLTFQFDTVFKKTATHVPMHNYITHLPPLTKLRRLLMQNGISPTKWDNANEGKEKFQEI